MADGSAKIDLLVLAAGASRRMGGVDKLLQTVEGEPLLSIMVARAVHAGQAVGAASYVSIPADDQAKQDLASEAGGRCLEVANPAKGLSQSFIAYAMVRKPDSAVMVLPADMAAITSADMAMMLERWTKSPDEIFRGAAADGTLGHPVIIPAHIAARFGSLSGDYGAQVLIKGEKISPVPLPDDHATLDLDTPQAWSEWRAKEVRTD